MPKICLGQDGFVNTGQGIDTDREAILSFAQKEKFQGIELHSFYEEYDISRAEAIKSDYAKRGLEIPGLQTGHLTFYHNPISDDKQERKEYVDAVGEALKFAQAIGAVHSTLTPPTPMLGTSEEYLKLLDRYIETLNEVVAIAEERGVVMAVEPEPPMMLNGGNFRDPLEDIRHVLDSVKSKNLCILFDVPHANVLSKGDPSGFLKKLNGRVSWVHFADNDFSLTPMIGTATHLEFGKGNIDTEKLMLTLKQEVPNLRWLQIDTWENSHPFEVAAENRNKLLATLRRISWN
jgi:sugar phosphate isomerase/epimerase